MKKSLYLLFTLIVSLSAWAENTFKVCALNVDGMPRNVKILGVFDLNLNPDAKEGAGATAIGQKLATIDYDFVGLSEDFNFNDSIYEQVNGIYGQGTHRGAIEITASSYGNFIIQQTVFNTDGLNAYYRLSTTSIANETWVQWNDRSGYTDNGADGMIAKGYRYYTVTFNDSVEVDIYILHMDAECDNGSQAARQSNIRQVANAILQSNNKRPVIVMGDTNCRYNRDKLKECMIDALNADERFSAMDAWVEHELDSIYPAYVAEADATQSLLVNELGYQKGEVVDKVIYVNNADAPYHISADYYLQDVSFVNEAGEPLADHWPVVVEFTYWKKEVVIEADTLVPAVPTAGGEYYIYHPNTQRFLSHNGSNLTTTLDPEMSWTMTYVSAANEVYTMNMKGGDYWFNLAKSGAFGTSATPTLSTSSQTIELKTSTTTAQSYKIFRTASPVRYLNYNGSEFTGAQNMGVQNDWIFISKSQYDNATPKASYLLPDLSDRHPNPMPNTFPSGYVPTSIFSPSSNVVSPAKLIQQRGEILILRDNNRYTLHGQSY